MVKLYYTPHSCGASSFISAFIARLNFECETVELTTHKTASGVDFYTINPKGNVPTLILDDGTVLNENIACLEYIADVASRKHALAPQHGTNESYVFKQILSYIATEIHPAIGLFFNPDSKNEHIRDFALKSFEKKMKYLQNNILSDDRVYVFGDSFTVADAYLHIALSWTKYVNIDLSDYPIAYKYYNSICQVSEVLAAKDRMSENPETIV